ncbi:MAG: putative sugar nucleotidyl transferase [bacterium]
MIHSQIILFEDQIARGRHFKPLTYTRPFADLLVGAYSAIERIKTHALPETRVGLHVSADLVGVTKQRHPDLLVNESELARRTVFINSRLLITDHYFKLLQSEENTLFRVEESPEDILGFCLGGELPEAILQKLTSGELFTEADFTFEVRNMPKPKFFTSLWNMVNSNSVVIQSDMKRMLAQGKRKFTNDLHKNPRVKTSGLHNLSVNESARFARTCYLNGKGGPILIEEDVVCEPNAIILGPAIIRAGTVIKAGAKIHAGNTIGPVCKVGGEVENSIFQGYSNKQHDGFVGHSYIGEWCNIGAGTNTSDLKNDYSNVRVTIENEVIDTRALFVGLLMGDHSKSAIGTRFNTGTAVGVSSNIFASGFPPKWIPNFSWCGDAGIEPYRIEKALEVAKTVMVRRTKTLSEDEKTLLRKLAGQ